MAAMPCPSTKQAMRVEIKKQFSILLGFDKKFNHNLDRAVEGFDRVDFWTEISDKDSSTQPRTYEIHNPTLCFMH